MSAFQEVSRFWEGSSVGMEMGHSESYLPNKTNNESGTSLMWYNYGATLKGESYLKIKWFYQFMTNMTIQDMLAHVTIVLHDTFISIPVLPRVVDIFGL